MMLHFDRVLRVGIAIPTSSELITRFCLETRTPDPMDSLFIRSCCLGGATTLAGELLQSHCVEKEEWSILLSCVCERGYVDIVRLLLQDERVDPAQQESYCLRAACMYQHVEIIILLIQDGRCDLTRHRRLLIETAEHAKSEELRRLLEEKQINRDYRSAFVVIVLAFLVLIWQLA